MNNFHFFINFLNKQFYTFLFVVFIFFLSENRFIKQTFILYLVILCLVYKDPNRTIVACKQKTDFVK